MRSPSDFVKRHDGKDKGYQIRYNSSHMAKHEFLFWDQLDFKLLTFVDQMSTKSMKLLQVTQSYITADIIMKSRFPEAQRNLCPHLFHGENAIQLNSVVLTSKLCLKTDTLTKQTFYTQSIPKDHFFLVYVQKIYCSKKSIAFLLQKLGVSDRQGPTFTITSLR